MFFTRQQLEDLEDRGLAPYGNRSKLSKGRSYPENEPEYRTAFQRDRDRILHTTAFRRLEYKTQVEAAAYRGRPVWLEIVSPWSRPVRESPFPLTAREKLARNSVILLLLALVATGAILAKRNIRLGRGDRRGAFRLALVLAALGTAGFLLRAHHVADPTLELSLLARGAGLSVLVAATIWLFYLALEPYVRRLRPWTLVSWTRLLNGGVRDVVVGRDVLIGMVWGACVAIGYAVAERAPGWLGVPAAAPEAYFADSLLSLRQILALVTMLPVNAALFGLGILLLFLVLRFATRRDSLAAALIAVVLTAGLLGESGDGRWLLVPLGLLLYGSYVFLLLRFGVLSAIVAQFTGDCSRLPTPWTSTGGPGPRRWSTCPSSWPWPCWRSGCLSGASPPSRGTSPEKRRPRPAPEVRRHFSPPADVCW